MSTSVVEEKRDEGRLSETVDVSGDNDEERNSTLLDASRDTFPTALLGGRGCVSDSLWSRQSALQVVFCYISMLDVCRTDSSKIQGRWFVPATIPNIAMHYYVMSVESRLCSVVIQVNPLIAEMIADPVMLDLIMMVTL